MIIYIFTITFFLINGQNFCLANDSASINSEENVYDINQEYPKSKNLNYKLYFTSPKNAKGYLSRIFLENIRDVFKPDIFVETGTFLGNSALSASKVFKNVHTIELCQDLYQKSKNFLKNQTNVSVHYGDSSKVLPNLLASLKGKIIFWLDGHYSGVHEGHQTALGENNPLLLELDVIKKSNHNDSIIMVDDIRLCDENINKLNDPIIGGYPLLNEICAKILEINKNYKFLIIGDVLLAYPYDQKISSSLTLQACTISRLYNGTNIDEDFVLEMEKVISNANGIERKAITILNNSFGSDLHAIDYGVARHYILWHALILLKNGKFKRCYNRLKHIESKGFNHWRIYFYMAQAAYGFGKIGLGNRHIKRISTKINKIHGKLIYKKAAQYINSVK